MEQNRKRARAIAIAKTADAASRRLFFVTTATAFALTALFAVVALIAG